MTAQRCVPGRPGRRRRAIGSTVVASWLLVTGSAVSACSPSAADALDSSQIDGLRSDPDQQGLMVSYLGGACDGAAKLVVTEAGTRIEADVVVRRGSGACPAVGIPRTVAARLSEPIGDRTIWIGGRQQTPFDGARLLTPATLPSGFGALTEQGFADQPSSDPAAAQVTTTWVIRRSDASPVTAEGCPFARGSLEVRVGPASVQRTGGLTKIGSARIGTANARSYRIGSARKPSGWAYVWTAGGGSVQVLSVAECTGDEVLNRSELLAVAASLRPA